MPITAELADGRRLEFPDGTDPAVIQATVKRVMSGEVQTSVAAGRALAGIPRQLGLGARYLMEGLPSIADIAWEPARQLAVNPALRAAGLPSLPSMAGSGKSLADMVGLPSPETADERVVGDASRMVAGVAGGGGLLQQGAKAAGGAAKRVIEQALARPLEQGAAAAGAGLAGGAVREGGGGEGNQLLAAVLGGVAAPVAVSGVIGAGRSAAQAARSLTGGQTAQIDGQLQMLLGQQGIDWSRLSDTVKASMRQDAAAMIQRGQPLDPAAVRRLAEFRMIEATPLRGDITQNARDVTAQRNLAKTQANMPGAFGGPDLPAITQDNAKRVLGALDGSATSAVDSGGTARGIMGVIGSKDARMRAIENRLYSRANSAAGQDIELARGVFTQQAFANLAAKNKTAFLPEEIGKLLDDISRGVDARGNPVPFNVAAIDNLKTILATAQRGTANGNARAAIGAVREALDNTPVAPIKRDFGGGQMVTEGGAAFLQQQDQLPGEALRAYDRARAFARGRRTWQESAAFIEDALDNADPEKFVQKHIVGGRVDDLQRMARELQQQPQLVEATRRQMVEYILKRGGADVERGVFSSKGMLDALEQLGDRRLGVFFSPAEIQKIKAAIQVGRSMQAQPIGSAVNNSNTGAMVLGRVANIISNATGLPVLGPMVATPLQGAVLSAQARSAANIRPALIGPQAPQPGMSLLPAAAVLGGGAGLLAP